jgi:hypothetical protein
LNKWAFLTYLKRFIPSAQTSQRLFLICAGSWLAQTILVDLFVVPTLFRTLDQFFVAGTIGMKLFQKMNLFDMTWAFGLFLFSLHRQNIFLRMIVFSLLLLAATYFIHLTPHLVNLTELWKQAESQGTIGIATYSDIQQEHQFYHNLYRGLEGVKIFLLGFVLVFEVRAK